MNEQTVEQMTAEPMIEPDVTAEPVDRSQLVRIVEATLFAAGDPLSVERLQQLFDEESCPAREEFEAALDELAAIYQDRGVELVKVATGWRFQSRQNLAPWVSRLWEERAPRYSRALLETLALIAYRQPITRAEIEEIRGVSVSTNIVKTLTERGWVRVVGHRDVPGKPAMYATTRDFLDYFNLQSLGDLPTLAEIRDIDKLDRELELDAPEGEQPEAATLRIPPPDIEPFVV